MKSRHKFLQGDVEAKTIMQKGEGEGEDSMEDYNKSNWFVMEATTTSSSSSS
ncbi:hypothetical protein Pint_24287 [Pistacia integerrima]|uniref:Uncharacterized protein n=1 Tax=Pistacia integerrima TaxID=434235 RepID=A0ACC0YGU9_9ROSI|nr:hypothetical protein Pint_24287 [Pistacia integerrima]